MGRHSKVDDNPRPTTKLILDDSASVRDWMQYFARGEYWDALAAMSAAACYQQLRRVEGKLDTVIGALGHQTRVIENRR